MLGLPGKLCTSAGPVGICSGDPGVCNYYKCISSSADFLTKTSLLAPKCIKIWELWSPVTGGGGQRVLTTVTDVNADGGLGKGSSLGPMSASRPRPCLTGVCLFGFGDDPTLQERVCLAALTLESRGPRLGLPFLLLCSSVLSHILCQNQRSRPLRQTGPKRSSISKSFDPVFS